MRPVRLSSIAVVVATAIALVAIASFVGETAAKPIAKRGAVEAAHPDHCPPGTVDAAAPGNPLNDALGCVPATLTFCPEGTKPTPAGCLPPEGYVVADLTHGDDTCPPGWNDTSAPGNPLNDELGCLPNDLTFCPPGTQATPYGCLPLHDDDGVGGEIKQTRIVMIAHDADLDLTDHPCPEGSAIHPDYVEYGCIPYGAGPWAE